MLRFPNCNEGETFFKVLVSLLTLREDESEFVRIAPQRSRTMNIGKVAIFLYLYYFSDD